MKPVAELTACEWILASHWTTTRAHQLPTWRHTPEIREAVDRSAAASQYAITPAPTVGIQTWRIENVGPQSHEITLVKLDRGKTARRQDDFGALPKTPVCSKHRYAGTARMWR